MSCNPPPPTPRRRQPKLRSSCDGCGIAKLKCDRGQPECSRCISFGMPCVYGESRKFGRPPRQKASVTVLATPPPSSHASEQPEMDTADRDSSHSATASNNGDGMASASPPACSLSNVADHDDGVRAVWAVVDDSINPNAVAMSLDCDLNLLGPTSSPFGFISDCWGDSLLPADDHETALAPASTRASTEDPMVTHSHYHPQPHLGLGSIRDHDCCLGEAHEILGNLSIVNMAKRHCGGGGGGAGAGGGAGGTGGPSSSPSDGHCPSSSVPLDHVLRINREASDRLGRLLVCSHDRSPHLQLLYASIISRILLWYQQAADCSAAVSFPAAMALGNFNAATTVMAASASASSSSSSHQMGVVPMATSPPGSAVSGPPSASASSSSPPSFSSSSPWALSSPGSNMAGPAVGGGGTFPGSCSPGGAAAAAAAKSSAGALAVAPAAMAIGTFNVDDLGMQAALRIQLLSGELRRAGRLIDLFTSFHSPGGHAGQCLAEALTFGGVGNLSQILDAWLRGEHSRIANLMRSKLRELNADLI